MKCIFILTLSIYFLLPSSTIDAANPTEIQQQIEQVKRDREALIEEQKKLQVELEAINKERQTLGTSVKTLDATRKKLTKDISITQSKIKSTNLTIQTLEDSMSEKERQIAIHHKAIKDTLALLSEYDSHPLLLDVLAAGSLSDLWKDRSQLEGLNSSLEEEINSLRETRKILSQEKEQKERMKKEQLTLKGQLSGQKSVIEESKKAKEKLLAETKSKETEYQKMLAENLARQKESEEDLYKLESGLQIELDPSLVPSPRHGILFWPLDNIFITDSFGQRPTRYHNGADFRATVGTAVKTVLSGIVQGVGNTDETKGCYSYGRWILIRHGNGLSSVYAHLSASLVKTGQSVETGETIGYSGGYPRAFGSGNSRGPHLHLGLFASQGVEIRQFTTSKGCKTVSMPIALGLGVYRDPLAYLPTL